MCHASGMTLQCCHSGLDLACPVLDTGESSLFNLDSHFRGNDTANSGNVLFVTYDLQVCQNIYVIRNAYFMLLWGEYEIESKFL